jgi:hypothetical protein
MQEKIFMNNYYPAMISSRKSIHLLKTQLDFNKIGSAPVFDFSDISFISRSFAHEFIKFTKTNNLNADFVNANANVSAMFAAVKKTETSGKRRFDSIPVTSFKSKKELNSFFATI